MADSDGPKPESELLSGRAAERLLARAAELDSRQRSGAEIASLRAAAAEAGIRPEAFDAALAEMRGRSATPAAQRHFGFWPRRKWIFFAAVLALVAGIIVSRLFSHQAGPDRVVPRAAPTAVAPTASRRVQVRVIHSK